MDYDFSRLNSREFEHLCSTLFFALIGTEAATYGDGADGGRESTWNGRPGPVSTLPPTWEGYGVMQAKYRQRPYVKVSANASWVLKEAKRELDDWKEKRPRDQRPRYLLLTTNLTLSAVPRSGADQLEADILSYARGLRLGIRGVKIWHSDTLRALLDANESIRHRYSAFFAPGDLIAELLTERSRPNEELKQALSEHAARSLLDDTELNLTQAGSVQDRQPRIHELFIDLPGQAVEVEDLVNDWDRVADSLVRTADECTLQPRLEATDERDRRHVLIGGPGQGKSTIGQFLAQLYRSEFVRDAPVLSDPDVLQASLDVLSRVDRLGLRRPRLRRWPARIVLTDFADWLADSDGSLLDYLAHLVNRRSSHKINAGRLKDWVKACPWIVILDGLDEVPQSSNRSALLRAVRDFTMEVAASRGDVVIIATTRPQGYNDEFSPKHYRHVVLRPLSPEVANTYAANLLELRLGTGDRLTRTLERWQRAVREPATSRLVASPLQVSIMAILVERHGQAPRDRWRLFSQYYRVIYQREQEKGGELADLLTDFQSDIDAIHASAGFTLQALSEGSGDTESVLTVDQLEDLVRERLKSQGHGGDALDTLTSRIVKLTTDRLVFLSAVRADAIGFEIRSLQEFMAADRLVATFETTPEVESLHPVALSSHWRNVLLFFVGKIFAEREHLRDAVVTLCHDLNTASAIFRAGLFGSDVALAVLRDGVAWNLPRFKALFSSLALRALEVPGPQCDAVVVALDDMDKEQVSFAIAEGIGGDLPTRLSLARMCRTHEFDDAFGSERVLNELRATAGGPGDIVALGIWLRSGWLLSHLEAELGDTDPRTLAINEVEESVAGFSLLPFEHGWATELLALLDQRWLPQNDEDVIALALHELPDAQVQYNALNRRTAAWESLTRAAFRHPSWKSVAAIAAFNCDPSAASLANAFEALADHPHDIADALSLRSAWPLSTTWLGLNAQGHGLSASDFADLLRAAAKAARRGDLGGELDWHAAEARWKAEGRLDLEAAVTSGTTADSRGVGPWIKTEGYAPIARTRVMHSRQAEGLEHVISYATHSLSSMAVMPDGAFRHSLAGFLLFDLVVASGEVQGNGPFATQNRRRILQLVLETLPYNNHANLNWVSLIESADLSEEVLATLAQCARFPRVYVQHSASVEEELAGIAAKGEAQWPVARAILIARGVPPVGYMNAGPLAERAALASALLRGAISDSTGQSAAAVADGLVPLTSIRPFERDVVDLRWVTRHPRFLAAVRTLSDPRLSDAAEVALASRHSLPVLAAEIGERVVRAAAQVAIEPATSQRML